MNDQHTCEKLTKLTKKPFSRRILIALVVTIFVGTLSGVIYAGLATRNVGKISDELVILDENGVQQASVDATQTFSHSTRTGALSLEIKKDGVRIVTASATLTADTQQEAAAGITALILLLTGREPVDRSSLKVSNTRFTGDIRVLSEFGDRMINAWDSKARLVFDNYVSVVPNINFIGKLQLNAWTIRDDGLLDATFVILHFDSADPTKIIGGRVYRDPELGGLNTFRVVSGSLTELTNTPESGDFHLLFATDPFVGNYNADVALDMLADGTIDVRGVSRGVWPAGAAYTLEGTGNANFVIPNQ